MKCDVCKKNRGKYFHVMDCLVCAKRIKKRRRWLEENQAQTTLKQKLREGIMAIKYAKHNPNKDCGCETCVITNKLLKFLEEEIDE